MKKFFANNWIVLTIGVALITSMLMAIRNKNTIERNSKLQQQSELVEELTRKILSSTMHGLDLGLRGFALTKDDNMLRPYKLALEEKKEIFNALDSNLRQQEYGDLLQLQAVKAEVESYVSFCNQIIAAARRDSMTEVISMLQEDRGYGVWKKYDDFSRPLFEFEDAVYQQALGNYNAAIRNNLILQVCIVLLVLPALYLFVVRIRKEREARQKLVLEVEMNDRTRVFNPGTEQSMDAKKVIDTSIQNIRTASDFIMAMARGEYDVTWNGLNDQNSSLNKKTLAGNLIDMREKLKNVKLEDEQRNWINEGLAQFSEIVRNNQNNSQELAERCVSFLTRYLKAQQSNLFVLEGEGDDQHLKLAACYAFDRKKWIEKRIDIGSGLVGQAFLEGNVVTLKQIPQGYIKITSGLGDATPSHLVIVPLKSDVHIVSMLEIASFSFFEEHKIGFLKKAGEFLAAAILSTQTTHKMKHLLDQSRINEESMRQREEEMRQNMEELQATQEELIRKEKEMQRRFEESGVAV